MSLKIKCSQCEKSYRVEDSWAGKRVRCKSCGAIMVVPRPGGPPPLTATENPAWDAMAGLESSVVPLREFSPAPVSTYSAPPMFQYSSEPASPFVTLPNEDLIDRWVPWAAVAFLALSLVINCLTAMSSLKNLSGGAAAVALAVLAIIMLAIAVVVPAASGALMLLGVYIGSQAMKFPNHRLLYWRCVAAACAIFGTNFLLVSIGLDIVAARFLLALTIGSCVLWLLLRLRLPQFALAGGLALLLGILLPGGVLWGLKAAATSFAASSRTAMASSMSKRISMPAGSSVPNFMNPMASQTSLRQTSAAHLTEINQGLVLYSMDHQGAGPATLSDLLTEEHLPAEDLNAPGGQGYHFVGYAPQVPGNSVVAYEEAGRFQLGGVTILFKDGTVQFFPGNSADAIINIPPGQITMQQPTFAPPQVPQMPRFNPPQMPQHQFTAPPQQPAVDPTPLLQRLASAYQTYFASHDSSYPRTPVELVNAGLLKQQEIQPGVRAILHTSGILPKLQSLPSEVIVAYVLNTQTMSYTVLFGDWHIQSMTRTEFRDATKKSVAAIAAANAH